MDTLGRVFNYSDQRRACDNLYDTRRKQKEEREKSKKVWTDPKDEVIPKKSADSEDVYDTNIVEAAYLKVINVPCMYDIGTLPSDPSDSRLSLNVLDELTYRSCVKPDFL